MKNKKLEIRIENLHTKYIEIDVCKIVIICVFRLNKSIGNMEHESLASIVVLFVLSITKFNFAVVFSPSNPFE